jgi:DNA polymerase-3 subunit alpha
VFDTVHFPDSARKFPFRGRGFYDIKGKVIEEFGVYTIDVFWMDKLPMVSKRADDAMAEALVSRQHS